jgi:hypothetical protein
MIIAAQRLDIWPECYEARERQLTAFGTFDEEVQVGASTSHLD